MPFLRFQLQNRTFLELSASDSGTAIQEPKRRPHGIAPNMWGSCRARSGIAARIDWHSIQHWFQSSPCLLLPSPQCWGLAPTITPQHWGLTNQLNLESVACRCCPSSAAPCPENAILRFHPRTAPAHRPTNPILDSYLLPENSILSSHPADNAARNSRLFPSRPCLSPVYCPSNRQRI